MFLHATILLVKLSLPSLQTIYLVTNLASIEAQPLLFQNSNAFQCPGFEK